MFSAMLDSQMVEGKTGVVRVTDVSPSVFRQLLVYCYTEKVSEFLHFFKPI
jgi:hypothetical protein